MTDRERMQQALDVLEEINKLSIGENAICLPAEIDGAMDALRERLAQPEQIPPSVHSNTHQPEQEPVAWMTPTGALYRTEDVDGCFDETHIPLYTTPPQRKPLPPQSPCEMTQAEGKMFRLGWLECEAAHGIKGDT